LMGKRVAAQLSISELAIIVTLGAATEAVRERTAKRPPRGARQEAR
jgi:uncharacterized membrane protein YcaP (DUF421 family)